MVGWVKGPRCLFLLAPLWSGAQSAPLGLGLEGPRGAARHKDGPSGFLRGCWEHRHSLLVPPRQPGLQPLPAHPASSLHERKVLSVGANVAPPPTLPSSEVLLGPPPVCGAKESPLWFGVNFQAYLQGKRWGVERGSLLGAAFGLTFLPGGLELRVDQGGTPREASQTSQAVRPCQRQMEVHSSQTRGHRPPLEQH